jgi:hypothetical protein
MVEPPSMSMGNEVVQRIPGRRGVGRMLAPRSSLVPSNSYIVGGQSRGLVDGWRGPTLVARRGFLTLRQGELGRREEYEGWRHFEGGSLCCLPDQSGVDLLGRLLQLSALGADGCYHGMRDLRCCETYLDESETKGVHN